MRYVDEFRSAPLVKAMSARIAELSERLSRPVRFMEVCGGHTMAIHRFGIPALLPSQVELLSGPGCPVCVTPTASIDRAIELGRQEGVMLTTFGDLFRVPGGEQSLEGAAGRGVDVRVVYSPRDALRIAGENPDRQVIFLAVGFETTAPTTAATVLEAKATGVSNFRVLSGHKTMPGALRALTQAPEVAIDGFILPGHVSTIIGAGPYAFLAEELGLACCIAGFEPADVLQSILSLVEQCVEGRPRVDNRYGRAVRAEGNPKACETIARVFEPCDAQWRGIGMVPASGLDLRDEWKAFHVSPPDAALASPESGRCRCGEVLRGVIKPPQCPLFGTRCTPDTPVGPCMVSSEGACGAFFRYGS